MGGETRDRQLASYGPVDLPSKNRDLSTIENTIDMEEG
jgi:hypothetical protein